MLQIGSSNLSSDQRVLHFCMLTKALLFLSLSLHRFVIVYGLHTKRRRRVALHNPRKSQERHKKNFPCAMKIDNKSIRHATTRTYKCRQRIGRARQLKKVFKFFRSILSSCFLDVQLQYFSNRMCMHALMLYSVCDEKLFKCLQSNSRLHFSFLLSLSLPPSPSNPSPSSSEYHRVDWVEHMTTLRDNCRPIFAVHSFVIN